MRKRDYAILLGLLAWELLVWALAMVTT